jgi:hypothetical protein
MNLKNRINLVYDTIKNDCAITTAASDNFAYFLFNMLYSLHKNFPDHPVVYIYDLGLNERYLKEIRNIKWIKIVYPPSSDKIPYIKESYAWKPFLYSEPKERYVLQLDAGIVIFKSLKHWFYLIKKRGYLFFRQGDKLTDIVTDELWKIVGLNKENYRNIPYFAAGVIGFDKNLMEPAIKESCSLSEKGYSLGYSESEKTRICGKYDNIIRDCVLFRHDQTLVNLTFIKHLKNIGINQFSIQKERHAPIDYFKFNKADVWCAKRNKKSLKFFNKPVEDTNIKYFLINRILYIYSRMVFVHKFFIAYKSLLKTIFKRSNNQ